MTVTANSLITPQTPIAGVAKLTAANGNYDAPTAVVAVIPAASIPNGARLTRIASMPAATCVSTDVQLYAYDGTNYRLVAAINQPAVTIAANNTAAITSNAFPFSDALPLVLKAGEALFAAIGVANANGVTVRAEGGAY